MINQPTSINLKTSKKGKKYEYFLLIFIMPWLWWLILNINQYVMEWGKAPDYVNTRISNLFSTNKMKYYEDLRWNVFKRTGSNLQGKIFYNKGMIIINEVFDYLAYLSPRYYFQAGDGSRLSSSRVEPIPLILFIFWLYGLYNLINNRKIKYLIFWLFSAVPSWVTGQRNNAFLLLTLISNSFISTFGLRSFLERIEICLRPILALIIFYSLWTGIRMLVV